MHDTFTKILHSNSLIPHKMRNNGGIGQRKNRTTENHNCSLEFPTVFTPFINIYITIMKSLLTFPNLHITKCIFISA